MHTQRSTKLKTHFLSFFWDSPAIWDHSLMVMWTCDHLSIHNRLFKVCHSFCCKKCIPRDIRAEGEWTRSNVATRVHICSVCVNGHTILMKLQKHFSLMACNMFSWSLIAVYCIKLIFPDHWLLFTVSNELFLITDCCLLYQMNFSWSLTAVYCKVRCQPSKCRWPSKSSSEVFVWVCMG